MTVSMRVMSAGDGYKYLLRTVAAGDGTRSLSTPLTRYYTEEGTPPGRWMGTGVASLSSGMRIGDTVTVTYQIESVDPSARKAFSRVTCTNQRGEVVAAAVHILKVLDP